MSANRRWPNTSATVRSTASLCRCAVRLWWPARPLTFLFAIAAIWLVFVIGTPDIEPVVGEVAADSIAADAGFSAGDRIQSIDGRAVRSWGEHQFYLLHQAMKGAPVVFLVRRKSGEQRALAVDFAALDQIEIGRRAVTSQLGIWPPAPPAVAAGIVPDSPAAGAVCSRAIGFWQSMTTRLPIGGNWLLRCPHVRTRDCASVCSVRGRRMSSAWSVLRLWSQGKILADRGLSAAAGKYPIPIGRVACAAGLDRL